MKKIFYILSIILALFSLNLNAAEIKVDENEALKSANKKEIDPKNTLYIELKDGIVIAELFPQKAPSHVMRIRTLTNDGFYDGLKFHRVIDGFMAQTGDPTGTGRGGSSLGKVYAEFNEEHHTRGTLSMARASDPNSANSQFFIITGEFFPELDNQYTIFGRVIEGMEYVDKIKVGDTSKNGTVENPDIMIKVITGDMLNNKSMETIKNEIKVINELQNQKLKEDSSYKKKPVLSLLLETKNIDSNEVEGPKENEINNVNSSETKDTKMNTESKNQKAVVKPSNNVKTENKQESVENIKKEDVTKIENNLNSDFNEIDIPQPFEPEN